VLGAGNLLSKLNYRISMRPSGGFISGFYRVNSALAHSGTTSCDSDIMEIFRHRLLITSSTRVLYMKYVLLVIARCLSGLITCTYMYLHDKKSNAQLHSTP
jgi:hypothetical protein